MTQEKRSAAATAAAARILDAATAAFAELGFHGTSTRDIAARAGMSPAAIYVHHRSKEELLYTISLSGHRRVLDAIREASAAGITPTDRLERVARSFGTWHAEGHVRARVVDYEMGALTAAHQEDVAAVRRDIGTVHRSIIEAGVATGEFAVADPSMTSVSIISLGVDIARWYRPEKAWTTAQVVAHYRDTVLRIVGAAPRS